MNLLLLQIIIIYDIPPSLHCVHTYKTTAAAAVVA